MKTLGAYMIVKNEEDCIATCLNSIKGICDEIVIVDTGCNDRTMEVVAEINKDYGKIKTYTYQWRDDFSHARNFAMSNITTDYCFTTDADEEFSEGLQEEIKKLKEDDFKNYNAIELYLINYDRLRGNSYYLGGRTITRKAENVFWRYSIHEKLYFPDGNTYTIPANVGVIHHRKREQSAVSNYNKYAEIYFNEINEKMLYRLYNRTHFFFYLYFTLKDIDEVAAKQYLWRALDSERIHSVSEKNEAMGLYTDGHVSLGLYYVYSLLATEKPNYNLLMNVTKLFPNDNLAQFVALNYLFENRKKITDNDFINELCSHYGILAYNLGEIKEFVKSAEFHNENCPWSTIAIHNIEFCEQTVYPTTENYTPVVFCKDNIFSLPSKLYYLSKIWDEIIIITDNDSKEVKNKINFNCFKNVIFTNDIKNVETKKKLLLFYGNYSFNRERMKADFINLMFNKTIPEGVGVREPETSNLKVATCVLSRLENKYLREYVEYYKNTLKTDKLVLFDNNREGEDNVYDEIQDYIDCGYVDVIPWKQDVGNLQRPAYQYFYESYCNSYDWLGCFDADEYPVIKDGQTFRDFLSSKIFDDAWAVAIPNIHYSDSGVIVNDKKTRLDVYTVPSTNDWTFYKTIVRGHRMDVNYLTPDIDGAHWPLIGNEPLKNFVDADGKPIPKTNPDKGDPVFNQTNCVNAFIKHIPTGCIDDYITIGKARRGWPDRKDDGSSVMNFGLTQFSYYNAITPEKQRYWEEHFK